MKKIIILTTIFLLTSFSHGVYSAEETPNQIPTPTTLDFMKRSSSKSRKSSSKSKEKSRSSSKSESKSKSRSKSRSKRDRPEHIHGGLQEGSNTQENAVVSEQTVAPAPAQAQAQKKDKVEYHPPVTRPPVYAYFYEQVDATVTAGSPVLFEAESKQAGGIVRDGNTGVITIPEAGDYVINFSLHVKGSSAVAFGVVLNNDVVVPGSVYRTADLSHAVGSTQLTGSVIVPLNRRDRVRIVNLSNADVELSNVDFPTSHNASVLIQKLN